MAGRKTFRKVITSESLIEQINPENKKLMERFLKNFATKRSPKSVTVYQSNLNIFFCWCVENLENKVFKDLRKLDFLDFFDYALEELKWSPARFSQMVSCLSSFSDWIETYYDEVHGYKNFRNIVKKIEKPAKEAVRKKSVFTKEEIDRLMDWLGEINKPQEQCLLALMVSSGARASELTRFTTDSIDENNTAFDDLFLETTKEIQIKGRGVNGKKAIRYIIKDTFLPYYNKWLPIREKIMEENGESHNYIFIRYDGKPATTTTIRGWIEKWDNVLDKHLYCHSLRHLFVTNALRQGLQPDFIQEIIAWSSSDMVQLYNDMTLKERKWEGLDKFKKALDDGKI